jgi:hypothetical protein
MILGSRHTNQDYLRQENARLLRENKRLKRDNKKLLGRLERTEGQLTKAKEPSLLDLKKRAWVWFSRWVRFTAGGKCFTCGKATDPKVGNAGHYIDRSICGAVLNFFPRNVKLQCVACNLYKHGAKAAYRQNIVALYGQAKVDHLDFIRTRTVGVFKPSREYYLAIARKYKALCEALGLPK